MSLNIVDKPVIQEVVKLEPVSEASKYLEEGKHLLLMYGGRVLIALLTLIVGFWVIGIITRGVRRIMRLRDVDPTLRPFLSSIVSIALKVMLVLSVASMIGIETTSFVAALGAAGLAVGLALQGSLSNFAGGVLILLFKPFRVGDYIGGTGGEGSVEEINILYTTLITADNKKIVVPNGVLSNNAMTNFTARDIRRLEIFIPVAFSADVEKTLDVLKTVIANYPDIIKQPAPIVAVDAIADAAIKMVIYVWVPRVKMMDFKFGITYAAIEQLKIAKVPLPEKVKW